MLTERTIINFLIWTAGLIAAPCLALATMYGNFTPALYVLAAVAVATIFGVLKDGMCVLPLIGSACAGRFTFLPLKLSLGELCLVAMIGYYVVSYLALRRKLMRAGPWALTVPIVVMAAIIFMDDPHLGVRAGGGGREGGTGAIVIILSAVGYLCGISMNSPSVRFLSLVPVFTLVSTLVGAAPYIISTFIPSSAPLLYLFTEDINTTAYSADVLGGGGIVRNGMQGAVGLAVLTCLMAYYPISSWMNPRRCWMWLVALACAGGVVISGYRGSLITFSLEVLLLAAAYIRWKTIFVFPVAAFGVVLLLAAQTNHVIELPLAAQRTLAFLPGDWDPEVVDNTGASNAFRQGIIKIYLAEYASAHPWFGNGLTYSSADFEDANTMSLIDTSEGYWSFKVFITGKMFHTGWVSMYDAFGIIGSFFFIAALVVLTYLTGRSVFGASGDRASPLFPVKAWLFANIGTQFFCFFTIFGGVSATVPTICYIAIAWYHINRLEELGSEKTRRRQMRFEPARAGMAVSA